MDEWRAKSCYHGAQRPAVSSLDDGPKVFEGADRYRLTGPEPWYKNDATVTGQAEDQSCMIRLGMFAIDRPVKTTR